MLEAILDTARQLRRSRKLPQPRGGYRKPKNVSQRQQKGGGDGRLYSESISELASAKRLDSLLVIKTLTTFSLGHIFMSYL